MINARIGQDIGIKMCSIILNYLTVIWNLFFSEVFVFFMYDDKDERNVDNW